MWLVDRLIERGDQPAPQFAFQGTVNWLRGVTILCQSQDFSHASLRQFFAQIQRRQPIREADTLAFECLTMSMHNVSALSTMTEVEDAYSIVRSAIVAWYYATYYGAKTMLAACSGSDPQTHGLAAKVWHAEIVLPGLAKHPFDLRVDDLTPASIEQQIAVLRGENTHNLNAQPENEDMALGAAISYLKGTAEYAKWHLEEQVKASAEYKQNGFTNFRSNAAKALRDASLAPARVNYLTQAFRYRGKANYRDSIYLSYGEDKAEEVNQFVDDLHAVARAFCYMAAHYLSKRCVSVDWETFAQDIDDNSRFSLPFDVTEI